MTDIEIILLPLLAKGVFVLVSALCIAATLTDMMAEKGLRSVYPVLIWLAWGLLTLLGVFLVMVFANAHTHVTEAVMIIRAIALGYLVAGTVLIVHLVKRLRRSGAPGAG